MCSIKEPINAQFSHPYSKKPHFLPYSDKLRLQRYNKPMRMKSVTYLHKKSQLVNLLAGLPVEEVELVGIQAGK